MFLTMYGGLYNGVWDVSLWRKPPFPVWDTAHMRADNYSAEMPWLSLLAAGTTRVDIERRLRRAVDAEDRAGTAAGDLALQLFEQISAQSQQGRELSALNVVAARLAEAQGMSAVLHEVVAQSRELLGVDVAYLMLRSPNKPEVMRIEVVDGSMGSVLRGLELKLGEGLAGEVWRTGMPKSVASYIDSPDIRRKTVVDVAARSEHLGGILGVPLRVTDITVGVLLAAERRPRRFHSREIELLSQLGAHAAIAVRNARLFDDRQETLVELRESNEKLEGLLAQRDRAAALRERLTRAVAAGRSVEELCAILAEATETRVSVVRVEDVSISEAELLHESHRPQSRPRHRVSSDGGHVPKQLCLPISLTEGHVAWLIACSDGEVGEEKTQLLEIGATFAALVIAHERTLAEVEFRTHGEFLHQLLDAHVPNATIQRRAPSAELDITKVSAVAVMRPSEAGTRGAREVATRLSQRVRTWSGNYGTEVVVLVLSASAAAVKDLLKELCRDTRHFTAGVASCDGGIDGVRAATAAARQTGVILEAFHREGEIVLADELGLYRGLLSQAGRGELTAMVESCVGPVLRYDRRRNSDLVGTMTTYLDFAQHHAKTCEALHIHANTLYQRLERVSELLGSDWRAPERAFDIQLALRLRALSKRLSIQ